MTFNHNDETYQTNSAPSDWTFQPGGIVAQLKGWLVRDQGYIPFSSVIPYRHAVAS